jgi:hypothetical protein
MGVDYNLLKIRCPKCHSTNVQKTGMYKTAVDLEKYMRDEKKKSIKREMKNYICNECRNEFWI